MGEAILANIDKRKDVPPQGHRIEIADGVKIVVQKHGRRPGLVAVTLLT